MRLRDLALCRLCPVLCAGCALSACRCFVAAPSAITPGRDKIADEAEAIGGRGTSGHASSPSANARITDDRDADATGFGFSVGAGAGSGEGEPQFGACIALHVRPEPFGEFAIEPLEGNGFFCLPFAWVGSRAWKPSKKSRDSSAGGPVVGGIGGGVGAGSKNQVGGQEGGVGGGDGIEKRSRSNTSTSTSSPPLRRESSGGGVGGTVAASPTAGLAAGAGAATGAGKGGGGEGGERDRVPVGYPGDWICPNCGLLVYSRKVVCFKCHTCKPGTEGAGGAGAGAAVPVGGGNGQKRSPSAGSPRSDLPMRDGDWFCSLCEGHNFANKVACYKCRQIRPGFEGVGLAVDPAAGGSGTPHGDSPKTTVKRGDWACPNCGENVFAKRTRCFKCNTAKPNKQN